MNRDWSHNVGGRYALPIAATVVGMVASITAVMLGIDVGHPRASYYVLAPVLGVGFVLSYFFRFKMLGAYCRFYIAWAVGFALSSIPFKLLGWTKYEEASLVASFVVAVIALLVMIVLWTVAGWSWMFRQINSPLKKPQNGGDAAQRDG